MYGMRGLGTFMVADCVTGQMIDCDSWSNLFNSTCWGICTYQALPSLPTNAQGATSPTLTPGTVSTLPDGTQDNAAGVVQQQITDQTLINQQNNLNSVKAQSPCTQTNMLATAMNVCDSTLYLGMGVAAVAAVLILMKGMR